MWHNMVGKHWEMQHVLPPVRGCLESLFWGEVVLCPFLSLMVLMAWPLMLAHLSHVLLTSACQDCQALHVLAAWGVFGQPIKAPALNTAPSTTLTAN